MTGVVTGLIIWLIGSVTGSSVEQTQSLPPLLELLPPDEPDELPEEPPELPLDPLDVEVPPSPPRPPRIGVLEVPEDEPLPLLEVDATLPLLPPELPLPDELLPVLVAAWLPVVVWVDDDLVDFADDEPDEPL